MLLTQVDKQPIDIDHNDIKSVRITPDGVTQIVLRDDTYYPVIESIDDIVTLIDHVERTRIKKDKLQD